MAQLPAASFDALDNNGAVQVVDDSVSMSGLVREVKKPGAGGQESLITRITVVPAGPTITQGVGRGGKGQEVGVEEAADKVLGDGA